MGGPALPTQGPWTSGLQHRDLHTSVFILRCSDEPYQASSDLLFSSSDSLGMKTSFANIHSISSIDYILYNDTYPV